MRNHNTLSHSWYICVTVFWTAVLYILYTNLLFLPLAGMNRESSLKILNAMAVLCTLAGYLLTFRRRRNLVSLAANLPSGCALYFLLSYAPYFPTTVALVVGAAVLACVAYGILVLAVYFRSRRRPVSLGKCLWSLLLGSRTLGLLVLAVFLLGVSIRPLFGMPMLEASASAPDRAQVQTIDANLDTLYQLDENYWKTLELPQRLELLQLVADIEADALGIPRVKVGTAVLEEYELGCYYLNGNRVSINLLYLSEYSGYGMAEVICHEVYHSYQHCQVDLYRKATDQEKQLAIFRDAAVYDREFSNYVDYGTDPEGYAGQLCEINCDLYAFAAATDYRHHIDQYLFPQAD